MHPGVQGAARCDASPPRPGGFFVALTETRESALDIDHWMARAIELAEGGRGYTRSNPLVGAVVVDSSGEVIATGYHARLGAAHAEAEAIKSAGARSRGAALFVNLEPCCHTGRTGPCTQAIIDAGIERVYVGHRDPDPRVNGQGIQTLREAGIDVVEGVLLEEALRLNEHYNVLKTKRRPFITLKLALTLDGRIADHIGQSHWITGPQCRAHAHALRARHDAIVVGAATARIDNPQLNVRDAEGPSPQRFVIAGAKPLDRGLKMFQEGTPAIVVGTKEADWTVREDRHGYPDLKSFATRLAESDYSSLMVEGGGRLASQFLQARMVDKLVLYYGFRLVGEGMSALPGFCRDIDRALRLQPVTVTELGDGFVVTGYTGMSC